MRKHFRDIFYGIMVFICFKVYFCSPNIYLDNRKVKTIMQLQGHNAAALCWTARLFIIHFVQIVGKRKILFYSTEFEINEKCLSCLKKVFLIGTTKSWSEGVLVCFFTVIHLFTSMFFGVFLIVLLMHC